MNVYDFDKTIIDADSTELFIRYCAVKMPRLLLNSSPEQIALSLFSYVLDNRKVEQFKESLFSFLAYVPDIDSVVNDFWNKNQHRVEPFYLECRRDDDLIISASPEFIVRPMAERLGAELIATPMSKTSGCILGRNCRGEEKLRKFRQYYPDAEIETFYSDSLSDWPLASVADRAFLIVNHQPEPWPYKL